MSKDQMIVGIGKGKYPEAAGADMVRFMRARGMEIGLSEQIAYLGRCITDPFLTE